MSVKVTTWVWEHSASRGPARLVLLAIADNAHDDGAQAWPSITTLVRKTGLSERTVQGALLTLQRIGELKVDINGGPHRCNLYRVVMADPAGDAPPQEMHPARSAGVQEMHPNPAGDAPLTPQEMHPEPSFNRQGTVPSLPSSSLTDLAVVTGVGAMPVDNPVDSNRREGKRRQPRTPRHRADPFVVARAREIAARDGADAARAYLRKVDVNYGQASRADQLGRLEEIIAQDTAAEAGQP